MSKDISLVERLASASKLNLTDAEKATYSKDLKNILDAFSELDEVNVDNVAPAFQPIEITDRARDDNIEPSLSQKDALMNTKNKRDGYFVGPKAM